MTVRAARTALRALALAAILGACAQRAHSLPFASRAGAAPCAPCHALAPALDAEGVRRLRAGEWGDATGDSTSRVRFGAVLEMGPAFARVDSGAGGHRAAPRAEFRQDLLALHAVGAPARGIAVHVEARIDSAGGAVRLPVAAVRFALPAGGALSLQAGAWDAGLPFLSDARRATLAPYLAPVSRGAHGVELGGSGRGVLWALGEIESERRGTGAGGRGVVLLGDTYAWIVGDARGQLVGARVLFARQDSDVSWHAWLQRLQVQAAALLGTGRVRVIPGYLLDRFDDRPAPGIHQRHQYALLEALVALDARGQWQLDARFEHERMTPTVLTPGEDRDLGAARVIHSLGPGVRVALEASRTRGGRREPAQGRADATVIVSY